MSKNTTRRAVLQQSGLLAFSVLIPNVAKAENIIDGQGATRVVPLSEEENLTDVERQILEFNRRTQRQNNVPKDFPNFIREGYDMTILAPEGFQVFTKYMDEYSILFFQLFSLKINLMQTSPEGLVYKDFVEGTGDVYPQEGQQVTFDYTAYNESAAVVDSSYRKGQSAQTQLGIQGLVPGFEIALKTMKPGGKRRIIVPPELGPPVGPSTFFSAKQYEVFDVELRAAKSCVRRSMGMFSDVVCE